MLHFCHLKSHYHCATQVNNIGFIHFNHTDPIFAIKLSMLEYSMCSVAEDDAKSDQISFT